jgi:hypothetical protein
MQRVATLLQKITELANKEHIDAIEIDLMMDYTRVLYSDLLEYRSKVVYNNTIVTSQPAKRTEEPQQQPRQLSDTGPSKTIELSLEIPPVAILQDHHHEPLQYDIRKLIGVNDKYQIISELFGNRKDNYEIMLDHLNKIDNELDAHRWLQDKMYFEYSWREDSEALMILHAIMHQFYSNM